jgi:hypothetical protein
MELKETMRDTGTQDTGLLEAPSGVRSGEVYRLLGDAHGSRPSRRTQALVERLAGRAREVMEPRVLFAERQVSEAARGAVRLEDGVRLSSPKLAASLSGCRRAVVFLATVGPGMDALVEEALEAGRIADASVLDAIGSAAAEGVVERFQRFRDEEAAERGQGVTLRFSPGYCDWRVEEQRKLFDIVDGSLVGVTLSETALMNPRKSVTGIFGLGDREETTRGAANPCVLCNLRTCRMRRA